MNSLLYSVFVVLRTECRRGCKDDIVNACIDYLLVCIEAEETHFLRNFLAMQILDFFTKSAHTVSAGISQCYDLDAVC